MHPSSLRKNSLTDNEEGGCRKIGRRAAARLSLRTAWLLPRVILPKFSPAENITLAVAQESSPCLAVDEVVWTKSTATLCWRFSIKYAGVPVGVVTLAAATATF